MDTPQLSWKIATEPSLYWRVALNPFRPQSLQLVAERFPNNSVTDVVMAVILAEPEGRYDRDLLHLPEDEREEELNKQNDLVSSVKQDLEKYFNKNAKDLEKLAKDDVYGKLFEVVFGNSDLKQIELLYSQKNRIDLKLSIVNYVENLQDGVDQHNFLLKMASAALGLLLIFSITQGQVSSFRSSTPINQTLGVVTEEWSPPALLKIPSINVVASVEQVGLTPEGEMDVPKNVTNAGWYNLGPMPGELGSSVIAGHFNGTYGEEAVFANLNKLKEGDNIYIEEESGNTITFVVTGSQVYEPGFADDVFVRNDGVYLNLITCDGVWDESKESFSKRLVVFTKIVK